MIRPEREAANSFRGAPPPSSRHERHRHGLRNRPPLPFTEEAAELVAGKVAQVQDRLRRRPLLENVSSHVELARSRLLEREFLAAVAERADCLILLDVNDAYRRRQRRERARGRGRGPSALVGAGAIASAGAVPGRGSEPVAHTKARRRPTKSHEKGWVKA